MGIHETNCKDIHLNYGVLWGRGRTVKRRPEFCLRSNVSTLFTRASPLEAYLSFLISFVIMGLVSCSHFGFQLNPVMASFLVIVCTTLFGLTFFGFINLKPDVSCAFYKKNSTHASTSTPSHDNKTFLFFEGMCWNDLPIKCTQAYYRKTILRACAEMICRFNKQFRKCSQERTKGNQGRPQVDQLQYK